jgi:isoleucyl-tRNA synthetase
LNTAITQDLLEEGYGRDLIRHIQELRKKAGYGIADRIYIFISGPEHINRAVTRFADLITKETLAVELQEGGDFEWDAVEIVKIGIENVKVGVRIMK